MEKYTIDEKPSLVIVGIECRTSNSPEAAPKDIPKHWERFISENIAARISHKSSNDIIALYCDYEGDYTKPYSLVIGCAVNSIDAVPEGMVVKKIPAGSYAAFQAVGKHPETIVKTWGDIWSEASLSRTYTGDYEVYGEGFFSKSPQEIPVFIAVKE